MLAGEPETAQFVFRIVGGESTRLGPIVLKGPRDMGRYEGPLEKAGECLWKIPKSYRNDMRVDGLIFADDLLIEQIKKDQGPEQVANVATLPGIQRASLAMPDIHWGYGFAIGGVAATDPEEGGVISPGGVGYDINCGVRLLRSDLIWNEVKDRIRPLVDQLFLDIPTGVGQSGKFKFEKPKLKRLLEEGSQFVVDLGSGTDRDVQFTEAFGRLDGADPDRVGDRALTRGADQCGTLGSGNHFLEIQVVDRVLDPKAAEVMHLFEGQITVLIHSGSRGLGYQVCDDNLAAFKDSPKRYGFSLPDSQLACAPVRSPEGQAYLSSMRAPPITHGVIGNYSRISARDLRPSFGRALGAARHGFDLRRRAQHCQIRGARRRRRGAQASLRSSQRRNPRFPPGHPELPSEYAEIGQPVLIPGSMGTASWVLVGQAGSMIQSFGSSCHGAGRLMSRTAAVKLAGGRRIDKDLDAIGIVAPVGATKVSPRNSRRRTRTSITSSTSSNARGSPRRSLVSDRSESSKDEIIVER